MEFLIELKKYKINMLFVENCNAIISVVCYFLQNNFDANLFSIMWKTVIIKNKNAIEYCCFSNLKILSSVDEKIYVEFKKKISWMWIFPKMTIIFNNLKMEKLLEKNSKKREMKIRWKSFINFKMMLLLLKTEFYYFI